MDTELVLPETLPEAHAVIRELWAAVQALRAAHEHGLVEQASLRERVAELERRLGQNSSNSSRPPSSDPPWTPPPATKRQPSGRKAGGQPGHLAHRRELLPPEQVDQVVAVWPEQRQHCGVALPPCLDLVAAPPERHQVSELPPVQVTVTEYQMQRVRCPGCGEETRAALPDGVPTGAFGPHLQAAAALLSGRYRLSRRAVVGVLADLVGPRVGLGSVNALCQRPKGTRRSGDIGSPRVCGSMIASRSVSTVGSRSVSRLRPPPACRTRPFGRPGVSSSCAAAWMVGRVTPAARATRVTPPRPSARASAAKTSRRWRSFRCGRIAANLAAST